MICEEFLLQLSVFGFASLNNGRLLILLDLFLIISPNNPTTTTTTKTTNSVRKYTDRVTMDTIRPLPIFLGITGPSLCFAPDAFAPPSKKIDKDTAEKVAQRMTLNLAYFISNYAMLFIGTCIIVILMHPGMIIYSLSVYLLWKGHEKMVKENTPLVIMDKDLGQYITVEVRTRILYVITAWVVIMFCFQPFITVVGISGILILSHAFMRDPKHIEGCTTTHYAEDFGSGDSDSTGSGVVIEKSDAVV